MKTTLLRELTKTHRLWLIAGLVASLTTLLSATWLLGTAGWLIAASAYYGLRAQSDLFNFYTPSAAVRSFSLLRIVARYIERLITHEATFRVLARLRTTFYHCLRQDPAAHLLHQSSGDLTTQLINDIDTLHTSYLRVWHPLWSAFLFGLCFFIFLLIWAPSIAFLFITAYLLTGYCIPKLTQTQSKALGKQRNLCFAQTYELLFETRHTLSTLMLFNGLKTRIHTIQTQLGAFETIHQKLIYRQWAQTTLQQLLLGALITLALIALISLRMETLLTAPQMALMAFSLLASFEALAPLNQAFQFHADSQASEKRLKNITTHKPSISFLQQSPALPFDASLQIEKLCFSYPKTPLLFDNAELTLHPEEKVVLQGPSGIGKSTLIQIITRLQPYTSGQINIGRIPLESLSESDLHQTIGVLPQHPYLFNTTLRENLCFGRTDLTDDACEQALSNASLDQWYQQCSEGLDTWLGLTGRAMSSGQLRRLAIARLLLQDAPIWLIDEPTAGLDAKTAKKITHALQTIWQKKTVLIITHDKNIQLPFHKTLSIKDGAITRAL